MKCKRCRWPTPLWHRDLWSGLCAECRKIDQAAPGLDAPAAARQALYSHAAHCLERGETPAGLERKLMGNGFQPQEAAAVVHELVSQRAPYTMAAQLLEQGAGLLDVRRKLVESGLGVEAAAAVIEEVQEVRSGVRADGSPRRRPGMNTAPAKQALVAVGVVVFTALFIAGSLASFAAGGLAGVGYLFAQVGQIWLLILIMRECQPDAVFLALVIPFFTWYFACQRWDVAKWAFFCNVAGLLLFLLGACSRA
jgi:hypothetical protein